jgi:hypothetical protein
MCCLSDEACRESCAVLPGMGKLLVSRTAVKGVRHRYVGDVYTLTSLLPLHMGYYYLGLPVIQAGAPSIFSTTPSRAGMPGCSSLRLAEKKSCKFTAHN